MRLDSPHNIKYLLISLLPKGTFWEFDQNSPFDKLISGISVYLSSVQLSNASLLNFISLSTGSEDRRDQILSRWESLLDLSPRSAFNLDDRARRIRFWLAPEIQTTDVNGNPISMPAYCSSTQAVDACLKVEGYTNYDLVDLNARPGQIAAGGSSKNNRFSLTFYFPAADLKAIPHSGPDIPISTPPTLIPKDEKFQKSIEKLLRKITPAHVRAQVIYQARG